MTENGWNLAERLPVLGTLKIWLSWSKSSTPNRCPATFRLRCFSILSRKWAFSHDFDLWNLYFDEFWVHENQISEHLFALGLKNCSVSRCKVSSVEATKTLFLAVLLPYQKQKINKTSKGLSKINKICQKRYFLGFFELFDGFDQCKWIFLKKIDFRTFLCNVA